MRKSALLYLLTLTMLLSSCALFKQNRVHEHNGIEQKVLDIPVVVYPSKNKASRKLVLILSGDGGWIKFEDSLATKFAEYGFNVVGFNSRNYFWKQRTPEETASDVATIIREYSFKYKSGKIFLCGYSFGADVLPFIYSRLPNQLKRKVLGLEMLSPYATSNFVVRFGDLISIASDNGPYSVLDEVNKIKIPTYCFYGDDESEKALTQIKLTNFHINSLKGSHRYELDGLNKIVSTLQAIK